MFAVGDYVVHGTMGVCRVQDVSPLQFGQEGLYYTLQILYDRQNNRVYTPVAAVESGKVMLRSLIPPAEAERLLSSPQKPLEWVPDQRQRNEIYTRVLESGQTVEWVRLITCLYRMQKKKILENRTLSRQDRELLNLAEKLFYGEAAAALHSTVEAVKERFMMLLNAGKRARAYGTPSPDRM